MKRNLSEQWKALAVLILLSLMLIIGMIWAVIAPFLDRYMQIEAVKAHLHELEGRRVQLAQGQTVTHATLHDPVSNGLLIAASGNEGFDRLKEHLQHAIRERGGDDIAVQSGTNTQENGVPVVQATVSARLPERDLARIVHDLETGSPTVFFDRIRLEALDRTTDESGGGWVALTGSVHVYLDSSSRDSK